MLSGLIALAFPKVKVQSAPARTLEVANSRNIIDKQLQVTEQTSRFSQAMNPVFC